MKNNPLQVLLIEDSAGDARLLREMFSKEKAGSFELTHLVRLGDAEIHLAKARADIILLDMGLPDGHGIETLRRAQAMAPGVPVIVLSGLDDEALAAQAMQEGAQDYLIKGQIENRALPRALRHAIERQRMLTEAELARIYQTRFKDDFLSHVSHELRSPLNGIYQFVTILLDRLSGELNLEQSGNLEIVLRNVKQLQSMVNDLLEVTASQSGKLVLELQPTSLCDAIDETMDTLRWAATAKGITLSSEADRRLPLVCADPTRMRQILIILAENAIKFTPENGAVSIHARMLDRNPGLMLIEVSDSGCGISPDVSERIFERLFQAPNATSSARRGLGLGLYICKDLVIRQGGEIWATSTLGQGAVFSVTVPTFSLFDMIKEAFTKGKYIDGPVALVVTEVGSQTGWLSERVRAEQFQAVRHVLKQCLQSELYMLLPRMGFAAGVELYFIVAATGQTGAEALAQKIREQLDLSDEIQHAGLIYSTSYRFLKAAKEAIQPRSSELMENYLVTMTVEVQELMNEEISRRNVSAMSNKKILIVDDDPDVLQSMHVRLKANNYDTFFAADAISCMAEARKNQPDLVLLDLGLPAGDGFLVMERFKAVPSLASIPVIVISGRDHRANHKRAIEAGAKAFLEKPVNNAELMAVIRQNLAEPQSRERPVVYDLGKP